MPANASSKIPGALFDIGNGPTLPDASVIATGRLPNRVYVSETQYRQEIDNIFRKTWLYVARTNEVPAAGSFVVREYLGLSILVVRGIDDKIRVFHNACTHRSSRLVWEQCGRQSRFICPFHAWSFASDGRLVQVPDKECFPSLDTAKLSLVPIDCDVYGTFIFINLQEHATQSLADFLGEWGVRHEGLPWDAYDVVGRVCGTTEFNWKIGLENGTETYHAFRLHKYTLGHLIPKDNPFLHQPEIDFYGPHGAYTTPINPEFALPESSHLQRFVAPRVMPINSRPGDIEHASASRNSGVTFATHPGVNFYKSATFGSSNYIIFPNVAMVISGAGWHTMRYWPMGPHKTYWEAEFSYFKPTTRSEQFAQVAAMTANRDAMFEDLAISKAQHAAVRSGAVEFSQFNNWGEMLPRHNAACVIAATRGSVENSVAL